MRPVTADDDRIAVTATPLLASPLRARSRYVRQSRGPLERYVVNPRAGEFGGGLLAATSRSRDSVLERGANTARDSPWTVVVFGQPLAGVFRGDCRDCSRRETDDYRTH
ncbi:hypothetical protein [Natronorubrum thiooxidans]|uniref:hypothetical protein n=1 Tax=Natronorubrum thiooxidans TaxID=308853 RepID=UPI00117D805D|nr:hypothetical protein [Natronorubrum thiooxidans]